MRVEGQSFGSPRTRLDASGLTRSLLLCVPQCWVIGHLQLTDEERIKYKGCPVIYHDEYGFFFEPRENTGIMKVGRKRLLCLCPRAS